MKADYDLITFRELFLYEMRQLQDFKEVSEDVYFKWIGHNNLEVKMYEDFVLIRVPVHGLDKDDGPFVYHDAFKLVQHIVYVEPNNNAELINGTWFADFTVEFIRDPKRLVQDILNIGKR